MLSAPLRAMNVLIGQNQPEQMWVMAKGFKQFRNAGKGGLLWRGDYV